MPRMTAATKAKDAVARIAARVPVAVIAHSEYTTYPIEIMENDCKRSPLSSHNIGEL
jgi:hypothetical protein